jgi:signal peptidase
MKRRLSWRKVLAGGTCLAVVAAGWFLLAPQALGGPAAYVTIAGSSMEPRLHAGDLAVVRRADAYRAGDTVAYESDELRRVVLHRIVRTDGGRYVVKGDANGWTDSERPAESEVLGALWLRIPWAGGAFEWVRTPRNAALVSGLLALLAGAGGYGVNRRRRRGQDAEPGAPLTLRNGELALVVLGAGALACSALAALVFTRPTERTVGRTVPYEVRGAFSYSASAPGGPVYEDGAVATGDPVFLRLVPTAVVSFSARVESEAPRSVSGTGRLVAELSADNGWKRRFELQPPTRFEGDSFTATGVLHLRRIRALIEDVEALTGVERESYALTLDPQVDLHGRLAGRVFEDRFAPRLAFRLDAYELRLEPGVTQRVEPSTKGGVATLAREPQTFSLPGLSLGVATVRWTALGSALALLAAALAVALLHARALRKDEPSRIRARYGAWLVEVAGASSRVGGAVVDMATMEGLVRLAERSDRMILHEEHEGAHLYLLEDDGVLYRYRAGEVEAEPLGWNGPPPALEDESSPAARVRGYGRPTEG